MTRRDSPVTNDLVLFKESVNVDYLENDDILNIPKHLVVKSGLFYDLGYSHLYSACFT